MKIYVDPLPKSLSQAMYRVANALRKHAPSGVEIVDRVRDADLQVLHVIGTGSFRYIKKKMPRVIIQYCHKTTEVGDDPQVWRPVWANAEMVWSYYRLDVPPETPFLFSPLGVDDAFREYYDEGKRKGVMTSGYVDGEKAEAISEVAEAAAAVGIPVVHLGPALLKNPPGDWRNVEGINDEELARLYRSVRWVSGLRHVEGFELPAAEGLCCGAEPILFDRPEMRDWYSATATYVHETSGDELVDLLTYVFKTQPRSLGALDRTTILRRFDWDNIAGRFWDMLLEALS